MIKKWWEGLVRKDWAFYLIMSVIGALAYIVFFLTLRGDWWYL